jgi:hypothetical protein
MLHFDFSAMLCSHFCARAYYLGSDGIYTINFRCQPKMGKFTLSGRIVTTGNSVVEQKI